jgi:hypothetical protein
MAEAKCGEHSEKDSWDVFHRIGFKAFVDWQTDIGAGNVGVIPLFVAFTPGMGVVFEGERPSSRRPAPNL